MSRIVYASNRKQVGDGMRITRVSGGGTVFEVWTGTAFSQVELLADPAPIPAPANRAPTGADVALNFEVSA